MVSTAPSSRAWRRRSSHAAAPFSGLLLTCSPEPMRSLYRERGAPTPTRPACDRRDRASGSMVAMPARPRLLLIVTLAEAGGAQTFAASLLAGLLGRYD